MAFSNPADAWQHLRDDITFKTYADERLAMLYLQNVDNFPIRMLIKVFDVILDPRFKLEDITFESFWDIFDYISDYRRRATPARAVNEIAHIASPETHASSVPPLAVSLVVDRMMDDRIPPGTLAEEEHWGDAYELNVKDFHSMSLVHSTWTPIARRALQRRVVVPHHQIDSFLLSPLCGPWVTEMVVHWSINNGFEGATPSDVDFFQALLERTPRLRSLAFVTTLDQHDKQLNVHRVSSLQFSRCLELISDMVPNLENLWLKHIGWVSWTDWCYDDSGGYDSGGYDACGYCGGYDDNISYSTMVHLTEDLRTCDDVDSLSRLLPNLRSLKFFSMHSWNTIEQVHIEHHPKLQTVEIHNMAGPYHDDSYDDHIKSLYWSRAPGGELIKASSLSCRITYLKQFPASELSSLTELQLRGDDYVKDFAEVLRHCSSLVHLKLSDLHYRDWGGSWGNRWDAITSHDYDMITDLFPSHPPDSRIIREFCDYIRSLPRLRRFVLSDYRLRYSELQDLVKSFTHSEFTPPSDQERRTTTLIELCKERGIEFVLDNRRSDIPAPTPLVMIRVC